MSDRTLELNPHGLGGGASPAPRGGLFAGHGGAGPYERALLPEIERGDPLLRFLHHPGASWNLGELAELDALVATLSSRICDAEDRDRLLQLLPVVEGEPPLPGAAVASAPECPDPVALLEELLSN